MKSTKYKLIEFFLIFIIIPISFTLRFPTWIKMIYSVLGFVYIVFVLLKIEKNQFKISKNINWTSFFKHIFIKLIMIAILTTLFVWYTEGKNLFTVPLHHPWLWLLILFVYSVFSVYPQELIYRTFYFQRYNELFKDKRLFIFLNAIVFSLAHLFFRNALVIAFTFLGGLLFAFTYNKTKSTLLVSIEHTIYGCWLFTVGMGEMLGFPT